MPLPISIRLAVRQWLARPLRPILCSLAIAAAVALIVCVGAGFDSLRYSLRTSIGQILGVADLHVRPPHKSSGSRLPESLLTEIRHRPDVDFAAGRLQTHLALTHGKDRRWFDAVGVDPRWDQRLRPKIYITPNGGHDLTGPDNQIVLDSGVADALHAKVGDTLSVSADSTTEHPAIVVGIAKRPSIEMISKPTAYLPLSVLAKYLGIPPEYNVIDVKLKDSVKVDDYDAYAKKFTRQLGAHRVLVSPGTNSKAKLSQETHSIQIILSLLATISAICAALIIGTTLSVGVQERIRQFGQLRCIGASRSQLTAFLLGDAFVMLAIGEILGIILGFALSAALVWYFPQYFLKYTVTWSSILIAIIDGCAATFFGAIIPIWQITRVSPMSAVANVAKRVPPRRVWMTAGAGILCLLLQVALWFIIPQPQARFFTYMLLGTPLIFAGLALLGPALLTVSEPAGAWVLGKILFVRPALLRNAWSATPWRAGAMIAALMIGVTLLTAVGARGESLRNSWVSPAKLPDLLLYSLVDSISLVPSSIIPDPNKRAQDIMARHPAIQEITTVATFSVKLQKPFKKGGEIVNVDGPHFVAVDPDSFAKIVEMEYSQGNPQTALAELKHGGYIFVTKDFSEARGLNVGDKLTLLAYDNKPVNFTIAAVVTSTGMELVKNYFDMRAIFQNHAVTSVLGSASDARKYFRAHSGTLLLANLRPNLKPAQIATLRQQLMQEGYPSVSSLELKAGIKKIIDRIVEALTIIALGALCVASLGVANMVIASVHSRRYEFGVLRAIGAGRSQLIRLVLAEVTLIGIVAGVLGALAGLYLTFMAAAVDRLLVGLKTVFLATTPLHVSLSIGWYIIIAIALTTLLAWLASIVPAIRGAFTAQRTLLASGRT